MRRILFTWRGIRFYSYPFFLYFGTLSGIITGTCAASLSGLDPARVYLAMLLLFPVGLVGARFLFLAAQGQVHCGGLRQTWRRPEGGASLYGGLILSCLCSLPVLKIMGLPIGAFWDAASVTLLIGMMFTKVGCLLNGCCAGRPASGLLALYLPDHKGVWRRRLPTQLFEAGWAGVILLGLLGIRNRLPFPGALFLYTVSAYVLGRWWLEGIREDIETVGALSLHRAISLFLAAGCLGGFWFMWPR